MGGFLILYSYMKIVGKIIAIGGGEIGRSGYKIETLSIDKEMIRLSGKKKPKLLFIPTASSDAQGYIDLVNNYFGEKLGAKVSSLLLIKNKYSNQELKDIILSADIIYVGGGNTLKMMKIWRKFGVDRLLIGAYKKGVVMSGLSAGAICWFKYGQSDAKKFKNRKAPYITVSGLGIINALFSPHYDFEKDRQGDLKERLKKISGFALAAENCAAIEVVGDMFRIINSKKSANVYKVYWQNGKYFKDNLSKNKFYHMSEL